MNRRPHDDVLDLPSALSWVRPTGKMEHMVESGYCHCGCEGLTTVSPKSDAAKGYVRGQPRKWLPGHNTVPIAERVWSKVDTTGEGCWEYQGQRDTAGRGVVWAIIEGVGRKRFAHRIAWESVNGPIPDGLVICHRCDNPPCCRPEHLFLGTIADNNRDMFAKGRHSRVRRHGAKHPSTKTNPQMASAIRQAYAESRNIKRVAATFGLGRPTVRAIIQGTHWTSRETIA